ncbi:MAG TPA: hypothetical protein PL009_14780 [Flavipsychrobacter sp.]|nr:hypothetical protein [Flavipsychrobacter sp.]
MKARVLLTALLLISVRGYCGSLLDSVKTHSAASVPKYSKFEIEIKGKQSIEPSQFVNVFDSTNVDMYAIFTAPSGKKYRRNAFWMTVYNRCDTCANIVVLGILPSKSWEYYGGYA